jgi:hypothetical protein
MNDADELYDTAFRRARNRTPSSRAFLFVMLTALNTAVASILSVIITLGVVIGLIGNKERARQWYKRANELGHREAKTKLRAFGFLLGTFTSSRIPSLSTS